MRFLPRSLQRTEDGKSGLVDSFVAALVRSMPQLLRRVRRDRRRFEKRLYKRWKTALDYYEAVCEMSLEAGSTFNEKERPLASEQGDAKFETLTRLHARACSIASEVLALLRTGHASGAYSRWRSLHEIAVVSLVIGKGNNELAERYLLHEIVESHKAAEQQLQYQDKLGLEAPMPEEVAELKERRDALQAKYGLGFRGTYGWAAEYIGHEPTFADLEKAAELDHWRPYYRMASHGVHANPKGVMWNLGAGRLSTFLIAGASNAGLADPGDQALLSLQIVTTALLTHRPNTERLLVVEAMQKMVEKAGSAFLEAHEKLKRESSTCENSPHLHGG